MANNQRRSAAQWAELISEYQGSSETEQQFCQRHEVNFNTFRKWKYRQSTVPAQPQMSAPRSDFVEVLTPPRRQESLRIELSGDIVIECPAGMALVEVARLVGALRDGH